MHLCDSPKSRFSSFAPHLGVRASERDTATCQDLPGERLDRFPHIPSRLPYYNFVRTNLFLFVSWFVVQLGENDHLLGCLNARGQTAVYQRFPPSQTLSSLSYVIWSALYVLIPPIPLHLCSFPDKFSSFFVISSTKSSQKNSATLFWLIAASPLHNQRFARHPPCVYPPQLALIHVICFLDLCSLKRGDLDPVFHAEKLTGRNSTFQVSFSPLMSTL
jgi:hypothetical protein